MDLERARQLYETTDVIKLASNESPWGPHPAVLEAIGEAAADANRYPDQYAALLRERIAERYDFDPDGIAVANGSCEFLLAGALALCEPGAEIVFAWPAFSMYPQLAPAQRGDRDPGAAQRRYEHDLDAMLAEITVATQMVLRLQPEQPDRHLPARRADRRLPRAGADARDRDPRRGLHRDADRRRPVRDGRPHPPLSEPRAAAHLLEDLRARRHALRLRPRVGPLPRRRRRRSPAVQRQPRRAGRRGGGDHSTRTTSPAASS